APEYDWDDYDGLDVEGKTVVMLINDPGFANPDGDLFNGAAMTYYGRWTYKLEEAGRQGAAGAIIIHETAPASYGWDVVESSWSGSQADLVRANAGRGRALLEGWMTADFANKLFAKAGLDFDEVKALAAKPGFTPVSLDGLNASARIEQSQRTLESHNVVGMIPGTTRPDEYVLYVAHWDHIGIKPSPDPDADTIYNGAVDNATGTAAILDIAEAMVDDELERSALFIAVTLEESGLLGSAHYAETPTVPLSNIVGGINVDALNPTGPSRDMIVVGYGSSELEELLAEQLAAQERVITPDPHPEAGYFYRSDHASFAKKGVPMLYANSGTDLLQGGTAAGEAFASLYAAERYHQPADEYDETWDMSGIEQNVIALYEFGSALAQSSSWPNWYEDNEFRAIRDASRPEE
ncbi:MAG: M28 family peptidase, partial [Pseudomonadota bacterium]